MGDYVPPQEELDAAFRCVHDTPDPSAVKTVVLVPGVGADEQHSFAWNYIPQLGAEGFDICWVSPPRNGRGDMTQAGLYVAHGVKLAQARLGKNVSVIGHSAGPPVSMWGLRYDEEAASLVDDFIAVAGAVRGTTLVEPACQAVGACPVVAWQMHPQSNFVQALNARPLPDSISVTSIYSRTDGGIQPADEVSAIRGAENIAVQDICANQAPGHLGILANNTAYRLVLDALNNPGPANPERAGIDCSTHLAPGLVAAELPQLLGAVPEYLSALGEPRFESEPEVPGYARADVTNPTEPGEIASGSSVRAQDASSTLVGAMLGSSVGATGSSR
ncbi:lipase [Corynebacterium liangguodongii]|uniref:Lipase n=2 Tax=Corynebacterium liangguodongii TaxID=2079535 RepID=A0A2S0WHB0_9CORY|nr:lipase [Corynebacterium liangguodongii]PWB99780.1 lipase [Corynebacterium liangguodongii]